MKIKIKALGTRAPNSKKIGGHKLDVGTLLSFTNFKILVDLGKLSYLETCPDMLLLTSTHKEATQYLPYVNASETLVIEPTSSFTYAYLAINYIQTADFSYAIKLKTASVLIAVIPPVAEKYLSKVFDAVSEADLAIIYEQSYCSGSLPLESVIEEASLAGVRNILVTSVGRTLSTEELEKIHSPLYIAKDKSTFMLHQNKRVNFTVFKKKKGEHYV